MKNKGSVLKKKKIIYNLIFSKTLELGCNLKVLPLDTIPRSLHVFIASHKLKPCGILIRDYASLGLT